MNLPFRAVARNAVVSSVFILASACSSTNAGSPNPIASPLLGAATTPPYFSPFTSTPMASAPTTAPATTAPATTAPATMAPATTGPATTAPTTSAPTTAAPATTAPATTSPTGIVTTPTSLNFVYNPMDCPQSNAPQSFSVAEANYTGSFTATIASSNNASVQPSSPSAFTVTPTSANKPGGRNAANDTTVTVKDASGHTATVAITFGAQAVCLP